MSTNGSKTEKPAKNKKPAPDRSTRNTRLMKRMGSKTGAFDPEPPDQWLYVLRHGRGEEQALAWIKSKTVALGHESPYAIDRDTRKPLTVHDLAADVGWAVQTARNVLNALSGQGRAAVDDKGRIWLCADIRLAHACGEGDPGPESKPEDDFENFVQSYFSGYLADSIRQLPAEQRAAFRTKYSEYATFRPSVFAEAAAAARAITERFEDTILGEFGLQERRLEKRRPPEPQFIRLDLVQEPNFVQSSNGEFVQTPKAGLYKPENGSVQSGASLLLSDTDTDHEASSSSETAERPPAAAATTTGTAPPARPVASEIAELAEQLKWDRNAAARLLAGCREQDPAVSVQEILQLALEKWKQLRTRSDIKNPVGMYLESIPNSIGSPLHQAVRERLRASQGNGSQQAEFETRMRAAAADPSDPDHDLALLYFAAGEARAS